MLDTQSPEQWVKPYGDTLGDGRVQLSFTLPVALDETSKEGAKRLAAINWIICASPEYIQKSGIPHTPEDLAAHECHYYASLIKNNRWTFTKDGHEYSTPVRSQFRVNSSQVIADHVLAGRGIAMLPTYLIGEYLQSGRLVPVMFTCSGVADPKFKT